MQLRPRLLIAALFPLLAAHASATVLYVDVHSPSPTPPFTNWFTAATSIQDAVDAARPEDQVLVTNGVYQTGGRAANGGLPNRVAVTKPVTVQSVNGPTVSMIQGSPVLGNAVRCVYLAQNAVLVGFTLSSGGGYGTSDNDTCGGGVYCETNAVVSNCVFMANVAGDYGGGGYQGTYYNCTFLSNSVRWYGGGVYGGTLNGCTLTANAATVWSGGGAHSCVLNNCTLIRNSSVQYGGGVDASVLNNCMVISNRAYGSGSGPCGGGANRSRLSNCVLAGNQASWAGGAYDCSMDNCTLSGNRAYQGGGVRFGSLSNCTLSANTATNLGGGAMEATLNNCKLAGNYADWDGGAAFEGTLNNCLVVSNSAFYFAGGTAYARLTNCTVVGNWVTSVGGSVGGSYGGTLDNCIVYFNTAPTDANYSGSSLDHCCTAPAPGTGAGNFAAAPLLVDMAGGNFRLHTNSPCVNAGNSAVAPGSADLDGRPRIVGGTVDVGAYEFQPGVSGGFIGWLQQYGLPTDGSADFADSDGDGMSNWPEWVAGTVPTNRLSVLRMLAPSTSLLGITVGWQSVTGRLYYLQRGSNLALQPTLGPLRSNIAGQANTTAFTDTNPPGAGPYFYRVGVQH